MPASPLMSVTVVLSYSSNIVVVLVTLVMAIITMGIMIVVIMIVVIMIKVIIIMVIILSAFHMLMPELSPDGNLSRIWELFGSFFGY